MTVSVVDSICSWVAFVTVSVVDSICSWVAFVTVSVVDSICSWVAFVTVSVVDSRCSWVAFLKFLCRYGIHGICTFVTQYCTHISKDSLSTSMSFLIFVESCTCVMFHTYI